MNAVVEQVERPHGPLPEVENMSQEMEFTILADANSEPTTDLSATLAANNGMNEIENDQKRCVPSGTKMSSILSELQKQLPFPWITVPYENGINVLLLSRDKEMSVQRRAFFSFTGQEEIFVHRKPIFGSVLEEVLLSEQRDTSACASVYGWSAFVQRVITVVQRLQSYEVCVGVNDKKFMSLWELDKSGEIDKNPYGELRYNHTFRPFKCHLLVSTAGYLRRRCSVCMKTTARLRGRILRRKSDIINPSTPNVHLDRSQLLSKVGMQQKKLKHSHTRLARLRAQFRQALADNGYNIQNSVSEELMKICLAHTSWEM